MIDRWSGGGTSGETITLIIITGSLGPFNFLIQTEVGVGVRPLHNFNVGHTRSLPAFYDASLNNATLLSPESDSFRQTKLSGVVVMA